MSQYTLTPIQQAQQDIRTLRSQIFDEKNQKKRLQKQINQVRSQSADEISRIQRQNDDRIRSHEAQVSELKSDLRETESRYNKRIRGLQDDFDQSMAQFSEQVQQEFETTRDWVEGEMESIRADQREIARNQQQQINQVNKEVSRMQRGIQRREGIARDRLTELTGLLQAFRQAYPKHQIYFPERAAQIEAQISRAFDELDGGDGWEQTANSIFWQSYDEFVRLREEVICEQNRFDVEYQASLNMLRVMLGMMEEDELDVQATNKAIDFWTENEYSQLREKVEELETRLEEGEAGMNVENVAAIQAELQEHEEELDTLLQVAVNRVLASQQRKAMARDIAMKLSQTDYSVVDGNGYEGNDPRKAYVIRMKTSDIEGATETTAIIHPEVVNDEQIQNTLAINTNDHFEDEEAARQSAEDVAQALKTGTIQLGETVCERNEAVQELTGNHVKEILKEGNAIPEDILKRKQS